MICRVDFICGEFIFDATAVAQPKHMKPIASSPALNYIASRLVQSTDTNTNMELKQTNVSMKRKRFLHKSFNYSPY